MKTKSSISYVQSIVGLALRRSLSFTPSLEPLGNSLVMYCETKRAGQASLEPDPRGKILVLGCPPARFLPLMGLKSNPELPALSGLDEAPSAEGHLPHTESPAFLLYGEHPLLKGLSKNLHQRPFTRYDYTSEWNNLGFGRIRTDNSPWAAQSGIVSNGALELAKIHIQREANPKPAEYAGAYLTILDTPKASILWCARPVGPVDSTEWSIIERFISDWRAGELPCWPCLCQTPAGCQCLVTMRLDCDEDISSARSLFEWYTTEKIPFSLAVKTSLPLGPRDLALLKDVRAAGGTLLSHSHTHPFNWGTSYAEALAEVTVSGNRLAEIDNQFPILDLAVSPFHSNPPYAMRALRKGGFKGVVSGIIHNDPEYLIGRAGLIPFAGGKLISISQQSMLHGDCYRRQKDSVETHAQAFEAQYAAKGIFGYLDHPFSERYQYDWANEKQRLQAHQKLITTLRQSQNTWFWSQEQCFKHLEALAIIKLSVNTNKVKVFGYLNSHTKYNYHYQGEDHIIN